MSGGSGPTAGPDIISIHGLEVFAHHGVLADERRDGQLFVVDVDLGLDTRPAAQSDDLSLSVDYAGLAERVHASTAANPVDLIETLADRIATLCLSEPAATWVRVSVHKPQAPMPVSFADVALTIERSRS